MKSLVFSATLAASLLLVRPSAAQSPDSATDLRKLFAYPPLHRVIIPNISPDAGPTGVFPGKMKVAYGFNQLTAYGKGQTIALVDAYDDPNAEADLGSFSTVFKLPVCTTANGCFKLIYQGGTKPPADTGGWSNEIAIDTQWAHAIAPAANIMLVEAQSSSFADLLAAVDTAVQNGATVVSMSWSGAEFSAETSEDTHFNVTGVTFVAAAGDAGHGAQYPAASPFVVGVGGTSLTLNSNATWASETAWVDSGGGASKYETEPSYQMAVQSTGKRGIPDVAYDGDPNTGVPSFSSFSCSACHTGWTQWGGTSIGTPQWAALFAIVNGERIAKGKTALTQPQVALYPAAEADYHDITTGSNGTCGAACNARAGYDFVTGLGSPQANLLNGKLYAAN